MARVPLRLICDEQLGRLARWLRLQGYDTRFECPIEDLRLIQLAQSEGRVILTRDHDLPAKTVWDAVVVIEEMDYAKQLGELQRKVSLGPKRLFTRCLDCNETIRPIAKSEVQTKVPQGIYQFYSKFYTCPKCRKVFWRGTRVKNSEARIREFLR